MKIVRQRDTTALLTMAEDVTYLWFSISIILVNVDNQILILHPTVPVLGVADKVAVMAPPNIRLADGIVHVPSAIVKVVAVPALPSVGGALGLGQWW
jgi:hypothetical protein